MKVAVFCLALVALAACASGDELDASATLGPVPQYEQREGDAAAGYIRLVNEDYVGCGIPDSAYSQVFGPAPENQRLPGREGRNAELPYRYTAFTSDNGVDLVTANCLHCHAEFLNGELVVGLGNHTEDYTVSTQSQAFIAGLLVTDADEKAEWQRFYDRVSAIDAHIITATVGVNPADNIAPALFAQRDRDTLNWLDAPAFDLGTPLVVPVDVPPWWHMNKKHAMFYTAAGRGDHARIMMTASTFCIDTVDQAREIDEYFNDVRAYLLSLEAPVYPESVDADLAASGRDVFVDNCASCHGSYGDDETYPNLVIGLDSVGTDPLLATWDSEGIRAWMTDWFNESFYGDISVLDPVVGYVAPPLDGIWATAPYLHNGSVPTLRALLESSTRPRYFRRSFDTRNYDHDALGWRYETLEVGHDSIADPTVSKWVYDTTRPGYGNGGHTFGDHLAAPQRAALLEYLKTL